MLSTWSNEVGQLQLSLVSTNSPFKIRFENDFSRYGSAVVGITEINYNKEGAIQKATIKLNNNLFFSSSKTAHKLRSIYLGDVLSHEVGHMIGLNHSEVLDSTMFFESFPGHHTLSTDDVAGVRSLYDTGWGRITGTVMGGKFIPVMGAQVKAISRITGEVVSTVSNESGRFDIQGLNLNDSYYLYISPTVKVSDLPPYFANTQNNFCPGSYRGGFFTACGSEEAASAQAITLSHAKKSMEVGIVSINCSLRSSPEYASSKLQDDPGPIQLWHGEDTINEKNHIGYFFSSDNWSKWDKFRLDLARIDNLGNDKSLRINLVAHPFGNPQEYELKILKNGEVLKNLGASENVVSLTYHTNISYDLALAYPYDLADYEVHIRARNLSEDCDFSEERVCTHWTFPALDLFTTAHELPYLLSLGVMQGDDQPLFNTKAALSDNRSCLQAPFTYEVKRNIAHAEDEPSHKDSAQMSCGTIEPPSQNPPAGGLMTLCLGFMLASLSLLAKKTKNTLS